MPKAQQDGQTPDRPPLLVGERLFLRPLAEADVASIRTWMNDPELLRLIGEVEPMTQAAAEAFFRKVRDAPDREWFAVAFREDGKMIGETGLLRMFPAWRTTDVSLILGDRTDWGKGYGPEAMGLLLEYAFNQRGFHRAAVGVVGFNTRALRFWKRMGFKEEGLQREGYYCDDEYHDFVMLSILADEYRALHGGRPGLAPGK